MGAAAVPRWRQRTKLPGRPGRLPRTADGRQGPGSGRRTEHQQSLPRIPGISSAAAGQATGAVPTYARGTFGAYLDGPADAGYDTLVIPNPLRHRPPPHRQFAVCTFGHHRATTITHPISDGNGRSDYSDQTLWLLKPHSRSSARLLLQPQYQCGPLIHRRARVLAVLRKLRPGMVHVRVTCNARHNPVQADDVSGPRMPALARLGGQGESFGVAGTTARRRRDPGLPGCHVQCRDARYQASAPGGQ